MARMLARQKLKAAVAIRTRHAYNEEILAIVTRLEAEVPPGSGIVVDWEYLRKETPVLHLAHPPSGGETADEHIYCPRAIIEVGLRHAPRGEPITQNIAWAKRQAQVYGPDRVTYMYVEESKAA
jgi:hypothetical protein